MSGDKGSAPTDGYVDTRFQTHFNKHDFDTLKDMLDGADVEAVRTVARHWNTLHDDLVDLREKFSKAVDKVLEHWHGDSADRFRSRADQIATNFKNGAPYASHTAKVMGQTAEDLQKAIDKIVPVEDGWNWSDDVWGEMPWSDQIDDDDLNAVLAKGVSTQGVLEANKDNLSGHQKKRLEAAIAMENLGTAFMVRSTSLKPPPGAGRDDKIPEHKDPTDGAGVGAIATPMGMGSGPKGGGAGIKVPTRGMKPGGTPKMPTSPSINAPHTPGVSGGVGSLKPKTPNVNTGLDGLGGTGGVKIPGGGTGGGGLAGAGGGGGVNIPGGGGGSGVNVPGGMAGMAGGAGGMAGRGGAGVKGGAAGTGAGSRTGRPGMPGMGGAHGGAAGKGAGGRSGVSTGGAQARQKGGLVGGASGGKTSGSGQGGSGLHRSRGGTAAGGNSGGGRRPAGMMGMPGAHGAKGEGKGNDSNRPDYLVEDEETWTTERNVAPRVIE